VIAMAKATRNKSGLYLVGTDKETLTRSKQPSNGDVFFHHHLTLKKTIHDSTRDVIRETVQFWEKARIPIRKKNYAIVKLEKLRDKWAIFFLKKSKNRKSTPQK
jgi:threonine dehydrogenase-like Zn-dependent dehydrogenase